MQGKKNALYLWCLTQDVQHAIFLMQHNGRIHTRDRLSDNSRQTDNTS